MKKMLGVISVLLVIGATGCGTVKIQNIQANGEKYEGKKVVVKGWVQHNLSEIREYNKKISKTKERKGGLSIMWVAPEEYSYINGAKPVAGVGFATQAFLNAMKRSMQPKRSREDRGTIYVKYNTPSFPENRQRIKAKGIVKKEKAGGMLMPVLTVESWKYIGE